MKKSFVTVLAGLVAISCFVAPAEAAKGPVIYDKTRAIPTESGKNVRITIYTNRAKRISVRVDGSDRMKGQAFGKGCGRLRCEKWKVYAVRTGEECYELEVTAAKGNAAAEEVMIACEPFRTGTL